MVEVADRDKDRQTPPTMHTEHSFVIGEASAQNTGTRFDTLDLDVACEDRV